MGRKVPIQQAMEIHPKMLLSSFGVIVTMNILARPLPSPHPSLPLTLFYPPLSRTPSLVDHSHQQNVFANINVPSRKHSANSIGNEAN